MSSDQRSKYILSRITEVFLVDSSDVQTVLGDHDEELKKFYSGDESHRCLFFTFEADEQKKESEARPKLKMFVQQNNSFNVHSRVLYFIRKQNNPLSTNLTQLPDQLICGVIDQDALSSMQVIIDQIYLPLLNNLEDWGKCAPHYKEEFLNFMAKFTDRIGQVMVAQKPFTLQKPDPAYILPNTPSNISKSKNNPEVISHFEQVVESWIRETEKLLKEEQQNDTSCEDVGPATEILYWRQRFATLNSIMEQLKKDEYKFVVNVLQATKHNDVYNRWKQVDISITDAANEAKDNVKYLSALEKYIEPLYTASPKQIVDVLPGLIKNIRMMYSIARYYSSTEKMTSLFEKITHQMIANCKETIMKNGSLWEQDTHQLIANLQNCIQLNAEYQKIYRQERDILAQNKLGKEFDFDELRIFGDFDLFCKRIQKLIEIFVTIEQFEELETHNIDGIEVHIEKFKRIVEELKRKSTHLLDYTKNSFDKSYMTFTKKVTDLEQYLQVFINTSFENITNSEAALGLLRKFQSILQRESLKAELENKYTVIFHNYGLQLENIQKIYEKFKKAPPMVRNAPPVAGKIIWCRQLMRRIEDPMRRFQEIPAIMKSKESKKIIRTYNKVLQTLVRFENLYLDAWQNKYVVRAKAGLHATLLVYVKGKYYVNFDRQIIQLIRETKWLMGLGVAVPENAKIVLLQEQKFREYYNQLRYTIKEYERIIGLIPQETKPLMKNHLINLEKKIQPGVTMLTWTSMNIDVYLRDIQSALTKFEDLVTRINDIIINRIENNLASISKAILVNYNPSETLTLDKFIDNQEKYVKKMAEFLNIRNMEVEKAVRDILSTIKSHPMASLLTSTPPTPVPPFSEEEECKLLQHFKNITLHAITQCIVNSILHIRNGLGNCGETNTMRFSLNVELRVPNITLNPSMDDVHETINKAALLVLHCAKQLRAWGKTEGQSFYNEVAQHKSVLKAVLMLNGGVHRLQKRLTSYLTNFAKYEFLWKEDKNTAYDKFIQRCIKNRPEKKPLLEDFEKELNKYLEIENMMNRIADEHLIGSLSLNFAPLKASLKEHAHMWKAQYSKNLHINARESLEKIINEIEDNSKKLTQEIKTLENLRFIMNTLKDIREKESMFQFIYTEVKNRYEILRKFQVPAPKEEYDEVSDLPYKWSKLTALANQVTEKVAALQPGFKKRLISAVSKFKVDVKEFRKQFEEAGPMVPDITPHEAMERLKKFQRLYAERERKFETYRAGEELFGLPVQEYPELTQTRRELGFLEKLYSLYMVVINKVSSYEDINWEDLDFQTITEEVNQFATQCQKLPKQLKNWPAYLKLKKTIDDFLELQPLLERLSDSSMRSRHWVQIQEITGNKFNRESEEFKLKHILNANLLEKKEDIEDICNSAVKEAEIENKLKAIATDWSERNLTFAEYGHRGPILLKGQETTEIMEALEDSQMTLGSIMSSRYLEPFKDAVQGWMIKLSSVTEILEQWMTVQSMWMYMEAVFSSGDITKQLPQEAKKFAQIDKNWIKIMQKAYETKNIVKFCYENELLKNLPYLKEQLEQVQKSLAGYLAQKRNIFPRFYFVSDPVLLEILSQSSNPHSIQPHLQSIFDSIKHVVFDTKVDNKILTMISPEEETVDLSEPVIASGNVEDWLIKLEAEMKETMKNIIREAAEECMTLPFKQFIEKYPAQVALLGIQFIWTADVEDALRKAKTEKNAAAILNATMKKVETILNELTDYTGLDLTPRDRAKIETLITVQVHQRDVFAELRDKKVRDPSDFEWQKQARFYWQPDNDTAKVYIADIDNEYCYEYLGCKERLVITPLTDRCYITLTQALGMKLGGAPAGPAGTGKTETVKDLGRTLGKYVVVFNCSDQMDYRAMGKIYKGLVQSGAWGCFDEFNRIELEVLSVVAQQIQCVLNALRDHVKKFTFTDGDVCRLIPTAGIFITMNPGYQGRVELPENLKILFRGVTMMVPDKLIIIRVKLAAAGYKDHDILAKKFHVLYQLCDEQLSKQPHYDFGLRNILSVLRTGGETKRQNPNVPEHILLMRTLRDMNTSRMVSDDVRLYMSLIRDLFPTATKTDKRTFPDVEESIKKRVQEAHYILHPPWYDKVIQLYEISLVRHGIMVVGPPGTGKSTAYEILLKALSEIIRPHKQFRMNPKAITAPQMFGKLDPIQNEWTDGIFSALWNIANKQTKQNIWIICDGPVDSLWIENLNTVLDDNKLLTLANGDRIPMSNLVKMCFEVEDLRNASPATVSRAGIIYMSTDVLGWKPVFESELMGREQKGEIVMPFKPEETEIIRGLFDKHIESGLEYVKKNCKQVMEVVDVNQVMTCLNILRSLTKEHATIHGDQPIDAQNLEKLFFFSFAWSIGGLLENDDKDKFYKEFLSKASKYLPTSGTIYDYYVDLKTGQWKDWNTIVPEWKFPKELDFATLYVPTRDSVKMEFLLDRIASQGKDVLFVGGSGTSKTVTVEHFLFKQDPDHMLFKKVNFSSATTPNIFQDYIQGCIEKRFRSFGPPGGKKMIIFIDDLNMPQINEWGDQVTNEIVRQLIEMDGLYNLQKPGDWMSIQDLQFIGAMSHPGGGKNDIPNRLKRHFAIFNVTLPSNDSIDQIYGAIIRGKYREENGFSREVAELAAKITGATVTLWKQIAQKMLPTPSKFHYIFNLRDLSRVYQGLLLPPKEVITTPTLLLKLWKHECSRVFSDRLNTVNDKIWFDQNLEKVTAQFFGEELQKEVEKPTYFVNFLRDPVYDEDTGEQVEEAPKIYEPAPSLDTLRKRAEHFMAMYDSNTKTKSLDLVLFANAVKHLVRISRIISMPRGNALLVGVGGSGKQSLTRLASYIAGYETKQIVLHKNYKKNDFFEDLKDLYKTTGLMGKNVTFIFTDNEIKDETFLEYINSILSSGEVAGLFMKDEIDVIMNDLRPTARQVLGKNFTADDLYRFFINRVRANLHIVLCFSPVGEKFRLRAMKFPGLISGCTIDWFFPWPEDALTSVALRFLKNFEIDCEPEVKDALIKHMAWVHSSMTEVSDKYFHRFRRHVYSTPKSFLSFVKLFREVYSTKYKEIKEMAEKVNNGLEKLQKAADDVEKMKVELKDKEVKLAIAQKQTEELMKEISVQSAIAEKQKSEVEAVKNALAKDYEIVSKGKEEAEQDLAAAKPALEAAERALESITKNDITFLKKLQTPPPLVKVIFDGVLILKCMPLEPVSMQQTKAGNIPKDSYKNALKMMADVNFLKSLMQFDRDSINDETVELLQPYIRYKDFDPKAAKTVSAAAAGLCTWVQAMCTYHEVEKVVRPKMERLKAAESKLRTARIKLNKKEEELQKVQAEFARIQAAYDAASKKKKELQDDAENTKKLVESADNLIQALSGERERWTQQSNEFKDTIKRLVGDAALASAFISYCGPFNSEFRNILLNDYFYADCVRRNIPVTKDLQVTKMLTDEAQIGEWNLEGLPTDDHSIQNGIMVTKSTKWPLFVDPQGQGLAWLKKREERRGDNQYAIARLTDKNFRNVLEDCMTFGKRLIIENIEEEIDPMLDPVLEKIIVKSGRSKQIILSDKPIDYDDNFKLFLTTKLANPHFSPELYAKTTVIDFTVTLSGLEQQLLGYVIQKEKAELEEQREKLLEEVNQNQKNIRKFEDELLEKLSTSKKNLLEDKELIQVLASTKKAASEVKEKLNVAKETEKRINNAREEYRPVAIRGSVLYFLIVEMSLVNPMYQTSLAQFLHLFDRAMELSAKAPIAQKRISNIIEYATYSIYTYVSRGLFKRHKFLFVLLLACKIKLRNKEITPQEFSVFLKGGAALNINEVKKKHCTFLPDQAWLNIIALSELETFKNLPDLINKNKNLWKYFYDEDKPELAKIPDYDKLTVFERLLLVRSIRDDRTILAAHEFIKETLGEKYVAAIPVNLDETFKESSAKIPLICLLSPGNDPTSLIEGLAKKMKKEIMSISLGQGQEARASELLKNGFENGNWVMYQNCHLGLKFVATVEETLKENENIHPDFRLWITSEPNPKFPIGLLQMSVKLTLEGDVGIQAGMKSSFQWVTRDILEASKRPEWRPLLYSLCFLNTIVTERRKFGPLGWNVPYEFNHTDLLASLSFLQNHFAAIGDNENGPPISWPTIRYMICEIQYGGKVTDDFDRRLFNTYGNAFLRPGIVDPSFEFYKDYKIPVFSGDEIEKYMQYIETLPPFDAPGVFGLNENADISYRTLQSRDVLFTILDVQPKDSSGTGGETREEQVVKIADDFLSKLPADFNQDEVRKNIDEKLGGLQKSLNIFLYQEIERLQKLITCVRKTLVELKLAIDGTIIMSEELSDALNSLFDARVPKTWRQLSWYSATLGSWFAELLGRHQQLYNWMMHDRPKSFWMTGFYNPQGFLTAVRQEVTRAHSGWALDDAVLKTEVTKYEKDEVDHPPEGVYIHGLYLDGAAWDKKNGKLCESPKKVLVSPLPILYITATMEKKSSKKALFYGCPCYMNKSRTNANYIFTVELPTSEDPSHWIKRGVALLCKNE